MAGAAKDATLRQLKSHPEPLYPARHSWLYKFQGTFKKSWELRWFCLDRLGFVYAKTPQG
eukprot:CAMPEP_0202882942 /NCGR_PEP_ID=MMETSP1391-20130828/38701_1 /ASSEMBLY_ACC=CAM_ASM_000867 /TAXON_ID=1034604 /ORGANISM="Chlamydomonas leiostraca, Strain SAG 11-49" /LENGTH=59 /DNA_ID=CAMNT_0049565877 /DNA_START=128 /DNA_END=303 /DNA_ORIENTATION=-